MSFAQICQEDVHWNCSNFIKRLHTTGENSNNSSIPRINSKVVHYKVQLYFQLNSNCSWKLNETYLMINLFIFYFTKFSDSYHLKAFRLISFIHKLHFFGVNPFNKTTEISYCAQWKILTSKVCHKLDKTILQLGSSHGAILTSITVTKERFATIGTFYWGYWKYYCTVDYFTLNTTTISTNSR